MGWELYQSEGVFREQMNYCCQWLEDHEGIDVRAVLYPVEEKKEGAREELKQTLMAQLALFVVEYGLARQWMEWGVKPQAMLGHSLGEYVAACVAGVFTVEEGLGLVAVRGRLMQEVEGGAMLAVALGEAELQSWLNSELALAGMMVRTGVWYRGGHEAVEELQRRLEEKGVSRQRLPTSHAFHSSMMDSVLERFRERVRRVKLKSPQVAYISNVSGSWIREEEATDVNYWVRHLRETVRFAEGLGELLKEEKRVLMEVGPGQGLSMLARPQLRRGEASGIGDTGGWAEEAGVGADTERHRAALAGGSGVRLGALLRGTAPPSSSAAHLPF